ncbi:putative autotransporter outer membrane protein; type V secretion [Magnetospirillum sp. XM-1]|uniref:DUF4347 domain-containing protein n=1 Tax=Magnetospirillum sp. XM-1 TaxID=1663591 RepID=UPI00073DC91A|nr:DUF4347 domain-containing protein [Magnetospirillum sp. XM-1]CUW39775.1 putative autotransporter outer membrane protein; type V secretion [Magnetospirillum sp. XM-1]
MTKLPDPASLRRQGGGAGRFSSRVPLVMALEPRLMFDGAAAVDAAHVVAEAAIKAAPAPVVIRDADPSKDNGKKEVVFVDTRVADYKTLEAGIRDGVAIVEIDGAADGLAQMAQWAETHSGYDAIHVLSHGSEASLRLGATTLTVAGLSDATVQVELSVIGQALAADGDILVYGCSIASGLDGQAFISALASATGADVAASSDTTGAAAQGGNWVVERSVGDVAAASLGIDGMRDYGGALTSATITFESSNGSIAGDGTTSVTYTHANITLTFTAKDDANTNAAQIALGSVMGAAYNGAEDLYFVNDGSGKGGSFTVTAGGGKIFDLTSFVFSNQNGNGLETFSITTSKGGSFTFSAGGTGVTKQSISVNSDVSNYQGITYFTITAPTGGAFMEIDDIVLDNIMSAPSFTSGASASFAENASGTVYTAAANASAGGGTVSYSITGGADQAKFSINSSSGALTFVSSPNYESPTDSGANNVYDVVITATDSNGSATKAVAVTVTNVNEAPSFTSGTTANFAENGTGTVYTATSSDPDSGATASYSIVGGADQAKFSINSSSGVLTFQSAPNYENPTDSDTNNTYVVTLRVSDGTNTVDQTVTVTVTNVNEAPTGVNDTGSATEAGGLSNATGGSNATGNVLTNDTDPDAGATKTVTAIRSGNTEGAGTAGTVGQALAGAYGSLTLNSDGSFTYVVLDSDSSVQALAAGQTLTDSYNYTVSDGTNTDIAVLTITINGANDLPVLGGTFTTAGTVNDNATTTPFSAVTFTDVDAGAVSVAITYTAANGTFASGGGGLTGSVGSYTLSGASPAALQTLLRALVFTPTANQTAPGGTVVTTFTLTPADATGNGTADATTQVTATSINDAPVNTKPAAQTTNEDTALVFSSGNGNALSVADADTGTTLTTVVSVASGKGVISVTTGGGGTITGNGSNSVHIVGTVAQVQNALGSVSYTPTADGYGTGYATLTISSTDAHTGTLNDTDTVTINVTGIADTPSVTSSSTTPSTQTTSGLVLSRNAADGAEVTHFKITGITNGTLYKNDGTTQINNGDFITFAEGNAGLKFTPSGGSDGSFTAQASTSGADGGLGGSTINAAIAVGAAVANPTVNEDTDSGAIAITRGSGETFYKITSITGGTLYSDAGYTTQINNGDFIANAGATTNVYFRPTANRNTTTGGNGSFVLQASSASNDGGLSGSLVTSTITLAPVADTPSVASPTVNEDTDSGAIAITRAAGDGAETTHYKITGITGGTLYSDASYTTQINNGDFIASGGATTNVYFRPTANRNTTTGGNGAFTVQASKSGVDAGLGGSTATSTITLAPVADTPSVASPTVNEDTDSGAIAITRAAGDGAETSHYKITGITGGTLYSDAGYTTQISNGDFIASGGATTNVYFRPTANRNSTTGGNGAFTVQASKSGVDAGLGGSTATSTITLTAIADTPSVTAASTAPSTQTTSGLVLSRNAGDGTETTHFKITGITNGTLYKNDGTTQINNGDFITFAEGNAGLKFTPSGSSAGSFTAQASKAANDGGLGGSTVNAAITVNRAPVAGGAALTLTDGKVGSAYSFSLPAGTFTDADNDTLSYTVSGLPAGLSMSTAGVISGNPTTPVDSVTLTFTATDPSNATATKTATLKIKAADVVAPPPQQQASSPPPPPTPPLPSEPPSAPLVTTVRANQTFVAIATAGISAVGGTPINNLVASNNQSASNLVSNDARNAASFGTSLSATISMVGGTPITNMVSATMSFASQKTAFNTITEFGGLIPALGGGNPFAAGVLSRGGWNVGGVELAASLGWEFLKPAAAGPVEGSDGPIVGSQVPDEAMALPGKLAKAVGRPSLTEQLRNLNRDGQQSDAKALVALLAGKGRAA